MPRRVGRRIRSKHHRRMPQWRRNIKNPRLHHNGAESQAKRPRENKGNTSRRKSRNWPNNPITRELHIQQTGLR
jgi:hypothetical protein